MDHGSRELPIIDIDFVKTVDDAHNKQLYAFFGASFISALNLIDREAGMVSQTVYVSKLKVLLTMLSKTL